MEALLVQLNDAVAIVGRDGTVLLTNRAEEFPPQPSSVRMTDLGGLFEIFHPDGRPYDTEDWPVLRSIRTGEVIVAEEFFRLAPDGSRRRFTCSSMPVYGEAGEIVAASLVTRDITGRTRAREQLAYLLPMLDYTEDGIIAFDPEWHVTAWNKGAERMYGWSAEEVLGRVLLSFMRVDACDEQKLEIRRETAERGRWRGQVAVERKDGSVLSVESITVAIRDEHAHITGYLAIHRDITERKRAQEQLAYLLPMLDYTEDGIIAFDPEWHVTAWNKGAERMYGWSTEEVLAHELQSLMRADISDEQRAEYRRELAERGRWRGEMAVARKDGLIVWIESINVAIRDEHGEITGYLAIHRDVTEREQAEKQLRDAKRRTEAILESITDAFSALDTEWRYTYLNQRALERIQQVEGRAIKLDDLIGKTLWEAFPHLVGTSAEHELRRALREQQPVTFETHSPRTGEWLEVHAYPAKDGGLSLHGRDITERKRAAEQLRYSAGLLESMDDAVLGTDAEFALTAWNRGAERMFGWTAAEALGHKLNELIPTSFSDQELAAEMGDLVKTGRWRGETTWYGKNGKPVEADALTVAVRSDQGQVSGYVCIMRDISERKRSQQELERRLGQQAAVAELGLRALGDGGLQALMDEASAIACRGLAVEYAKVDELLPDGRELLVRAGAGWPEGVIGSVVIPAGRRSPAGYALLTGGPVITDDLSAETRFEVPAVLREHDVMSDITVPIDSGGQQFGTLAALSTKPRSFSDHDISFVQSIANVLADAFDRAESAQRLEAAREAERSRIARDLHDEVLRELTDALAQATIARSRAADDGDERRWGALITAIQNGTQQVRSAIYDLRLSDEDRPFGDLLTELVAIQAGLAGDCQLQLHGRDALGKVSLGQTGTEVLRIVTEALTNSRRHSGAATVRVDAGASTVDVLRLEVTDDGAWPDRESTVRNHGGTGIVSMFHRARALGAKLGIDGGPEGGTTVSLELALTVGRSDG